MRLPTVSSEQLTKMKWRVNIFVLFYFAAVTRGQHIADRLCPDRPVQQNFEIEKVEHLRKTQKIELIFTLSTQGYGTSSLVMKRHSLSDASAELVSTISNRVYS